ncbi:MAG: dTDP-4-dehydrorhamnose reductase [Deltaproteobacteria bacterium]|nr:dTDP-4-dehydrorhamnose reductase [Deltaproteobacteria bacterium]
MFGHDMFNVLYDSYDVVGKTRREVDVTLFSDVSRSIRSLNPDIVVNASGYTRVDDAEDNREEAMNVNSHALRNIATVCKEKGSVLVHISTDFVFDGKSDRPYTEDDLPSPINAYGESKLGGEREVIASGCEYLIIRTQWLFGSRGKNFVFSIIDRLIKSREVSVVDDQCGCPTYTLDLAFAAEKLIDRNQRGIFHFSGDGAVTWYGFACKIAELSIPGEVRIIPIESADLSLKARRPRDSVLSKEKYRKATGEDPRHWEVMLRDFLKKTYEGGVAW